MTKTDIGNHMLETLHRQYVLRKNDTGADAHLRAKGIRLNTESWEVEGIGHLCIMRMNFLFNLVCMETVVLSSVHKDVPLFNVDTMRFGSTETFMAELYDTQLEQWPPEAGKAFDAIKDQNRDLPDYEHSGHWYDSILFPCSMAKKGKGYSGRFAKAANDYIDVFVKQLKNAADCSAEEKTAKTTEFVDRLIAEGGPAVDTMVKLFGKQTADRMVRRHMYGI